MAENDTIAITFAADTKALMASMRQVEAQIEKISKASKRAATEEEKGMRAREVAAKRTQRSLEALHRTQMQTARQMGAGVVGSLGQFAGSLGLFAGFAKGINDVKEFDAALTDLRINGDKSAAWAHRMEGAINKVSLATGRSRMETLEYARAIIVQTGNAEVAMATLKDMGTVALATGADFKSLGGVAVKLTGAMGIDPRSPEFKQAYAIAHKQGKLGSIEFKAYSGELGRLYATSAMMGAPGKGISGIAGVGALFQLAARGKTPDQSGEVATSLERFLEHLARDPSKIQREIGAQVGTWQGGTKVQQIAAVLATTRNGQKRAKLMDAMAKAGGRFEFLDLETIARNIGEAGVKDPTRFAAGASRAFGIEGIRVAQQLALQAKAGWGTRQGSLSSASDLFGAGSGGGDLTSFYRGRRAVSDMERDADTRRQSLSVRWDRTMQSMAHSMHKVFLPLFEQLVKYGPQLATIVKMLAENIKYVVLAWATMKTVGMAGRMGAGWTTAAGTAGEAGGAAAAGASTGAAFSFGRAAANAFALAPVMVMLGTKLGQWFAGASFDEAKRKQAAAKQELARGKERLKQMRAEGRYGAQGQALTAEMENTPEGALIVESMRKLRGQMTGPGGTISTAGLIKGGRAVTEAAMMEARRLHAARVQGAEENARLQGQEIPSLDTIAGTKDQKERAFLLRQRERRMDAMDPEIAALGAVIKSLESAAVQFAQGKTPVAVTVAVPNLSEPGNRAQAAAGAAARKFVSTAYNMLNRTEEKTRERAGRLDAGEGHIPGLL